MVPDVAIKLGTTAVYGSSDFYEIFDDGRGPRPDYRYRNIYWRTDLVRGL